MPALAGGTRKFADSHHPTPPPTIITGSLAGLLIPHVEL